MRVGRSGAADAVGTLARLGLAVVWLVSGALKLVAPGDTHLAVAAYDVLPAGAVGPVATAVPLVELALGAVLLLGLATRAAAVGSAVLAVVFVVGVAQAWARGLSIDCGCFGGGGQVADGDTNYPADIAFDTVLLAGACWLMVRPRTWLSLDGWRRAAPVAAAGAHHR